MYTSDVLLSFSMTATIFHGTVFDSSMVVTAEVQRWSEHD